jgi:cytochrome c oxidase assembly protein subunit 15
MNANAPVKINRPLHWFAVLTAVATFLLLGAGGLVTSHEAGMSVPDWPNSYGYNMFAFPFSKWTGGIFYEHTHRLWASVVGLMTTILAVWICLKDSRKWIKWLGIIGFLLVVAQGVLGGLRVTMHMNSLGIFHGVIAQTFFALTCAIALFTSRFWF